ncbi:single-stranded DNA-binding protein [Elusimicrobiota bacterium]
MSNLKLPNLNVVFISGRLTRDPDVRTTPQGKVVAKLRIASDRNYRDASGEWQKDVTYIDVSLWNEAAQRAKDRMKKGMAVLVEGSLRSRQWEATDGTKRSAMEISARRVQILEKTGTSMDSQPPSGGMDNMDTQKPQNFPKYPDYVEGKDEEMASIAI